MSPREIKERIAREGRSLGFRRIGFSQAGACRYTPHFEAWLKSGHHGEMRWMARARLQRTDPRQLLPGARTVISLLTFYFTRPAGTAARWKGLVSRYAWGADYHSVLGRRLRKLKRTIEEIAPGLRVLAAVDAHPLLEKEWAERAGLGWIGKHTSLIAGREGSWCFLSELVTQLELPPDPGPHPNRCGRCTACLEACPTGAIVAPYQLDARRCISYLTIELRGPIPPALRPLVGERIFGCDVCQEVCPWNRHAVPVSEPRFLADERRWRGELTEFLAMSPEAFRKRFEGSPVRRAGREGFLRNVCVALGNRGEKRALGALARARNTDPSDLVREHAAWAMARIEGGPLRPSPGRANRDDPPAGAPAPEASGASPSQEQPTD